MTKRNRFAKHKTCRPSDPAAKNVRRLQRDGSWVDDDGKPGMAFSYLDAYEFPMACAVPCRCSEQFAEKANTPYCPHDAAMDETTRRFSCANGIDAKPHQRTTAAASSRGSTSSS